MARRNLIPASGVGEAVGVVNEPARDEKQEETGSKELHQRDDQ